jgi:hypothetical protein
MSWPRLTDRRLSPAGQDLRAQDDTRPELREDRIDLAGTSDDAIVIAFRASRSPVAH